MSKRIKYIFIIKSLLVVVYFLNVFVKCICKMYLKYI